MKLRHAVLAALLGIGFFPLTAPAQVPVSQLEFRYDGGGGDPLNGMGIDAGGNVYITGGRGNSSGSGFNSYFIAKYDAQANPVWTRVYQTGAASWFGQSDTMVVDPAGNAYIALSESYYFGGIVKYDPDGNAKVITPGEGTPYNWDHRVQLHLGPDSSLYLIASNVVEKYSTAGQKLWRRNFSSSWFGWTRGITTDSAGNSYVIGHDGDVLTNKFNANGQLLWSQRYDTGVSEQGVGVALDSANNVVTVASGKAASGKSGIILIKYDSAGNRLYTRSYEYGDTMPTAVKLDASDNIIVAGYAYVPGRGPDFVTAKYDKDGNQLWMRRIDGGWDDMANAVDVDADGNVYVSGNVSTGYHWSNAAFFAIQYDPQGNEVWRKSGPAGFASAVMARGGDVFVGGSSYYPADAVVIRYRPDPNTAPVINVPADITAEAVSPAGAPVSFRVTGTDAQDGEIAASCTPASGSLFPLGTTHVTCSVTDKGGLAATGGFNVTVVDTVAPVASATVGAGLLWPPNHKLVDVTVKVAAEDAVDPAPKSRIVEVTSSEPDDGLGDGDTAGDIVITGDLTLQLRAERAGSGSGRVYTITVETVDQSGNKTLTPVTVTVPQSAANQQAGR